MQPGIVKNPAFLVERRENERLRTMCILYVGSAYAAWQEFGTAFGLDVERTGRCRDEYRFTLVYRHRVAAVGAEGGVTAHADHYEE